ncbi:hypothetical protein, partial [Massilia sp. ST3]|uniref:hypothetical protein n=1 Tax=Massilia sp. ST3 TaxID=2824903 RepID=UPI001B83125A
LSTKRCVRQQQRSEIMRCFAFVVNFFFLQPSAWISERPRLRQAKRNYNKLVTHPARALLACDMAWVTHQDRKIGTGYQPIKFKLLFTINENPYHLSSQ